MYVTKFAAKNINFLSHFFEEVNLKPREFISLLFKNLQTSQANNVILRKIKKAKF